MSKTSMGLKRSMLSKSLRKWWKFPFELYSKTSKILATERKKGILGFQQSSLLSSSSFFFLKLRSRERRRLKPR